jgi:tetratricopeptide (TPR) repeat protein
LALLVYGPTLRHGFVNLDDDVYVTANPPVQAGLTAGSVRWALLTDHAGFRIPLTWLSLMADVSLFGQGPFGFHLTNLLLHAGNTLLLGLLLRRLTGRALLPALAASLLAVHPVHVESVAWVTERKDVLFLLLLLLACLAYAAWAAGGLRRHYLLALSAVALSLGAKPTGLVVPLLLFILDWWPLGRFSPCRGGGARPGGLLREKVPFLLLALAAGTATWRGHLSRGAAAGLGEITLAERLGNAAVAAARSLGDLLLPRGLAVFYPYPAGGQEAGAVAAALLALGLALALLLRGWRRRPSLLGGGLWYLLALLPPAFIFPDSGVSRADRHLYLPALGLHLAGVGAFRAPRTRRGRGILALGAGGAVLLLALAARRQAGFWRDSVTLFTRAAAVAPGSALVHHNLGVALNRIPGREGEALAHFGRAVDLAPEDPDSRYSLADALARAGRRREAVPQLERLLAGHPGHGKGRFLLGLILAGEGDAAGAAAQFGPLVEQDPGFAEARYQLALALASLGDLAGSVAELERVVAELPGWGEARHNLEVLRGALAGGGGGGR